MFYICIVLVVVTLFIALTGVLAEKESIALIGLVCSVVSGVLLLGLLIYGTLHINDFVPTRQFRIVHVGGDIHIVEQLHEETKTFWDDIVITEWRFYSSVEDFDIQNIIEGGE